MTRMCSASSQGSSMWPNMTVEVERRPAEWEASMISTQRETGSLLGEMRARTPSWSTSAAVPGVEPSPASRSWCEYLGGRQAGDVAHVGDLHRRVGVQVQVATGLARRGLGETQPAQVVLQSPVGMDARLDAQLGRAVLDRLKYPPPHSRASCW